MSEDFNRLRLKYHGDVAKLHEILQMECRHKCAKKLPDTLACTDFIFPSVALAEMSTSDAVADIHTMMVGKAGKVLDMTAGLGIDSFHFASNGCHVTAIELSEDAARALAINARSLGLEEYVHVVEADSMSWLDNTDECFDVIFIDPARRDTSGRHVALKQCLPDITGSIDTFLTKAKRIIVKLSPMVDISYAKNELGISHCDITVIGTSRECKEVVLTITDDCHTKKEDSISCVTIGKGRYQYVSGPTFQSADPMVGQYIMQPYPAVMKGTGGKVPGFAKLHPSTHLYASQEIQPEFPGQCYHIMEIVPFNKREIRSIKSKYPKINVVARNFPLSAPELVKKLGIKEGGDNILFGATLQDGSKVLIITETIG